MKKITKIGLLSMLLTSGVVMSFPTSEISAVKAEETQQVSSSKSYRNVMYYGDWSIWKGEGYFMPESIPADQLTHLNFAFLDFDGEGNLIFTDKDAAVGSPLDQDGVQWDTPSAGILNALQDLREKNPNMKLGVSLGGWSKSGDFSEVAANPTKRKRFVENITKFLKYTNMDFVDVDWEYPAEVRQPDLVDNVNDEGTPHAKPEDKENYILLLNDIRKSIDEQGEELGKKYELTVALPASQGKLTSGIDIPRLFDVVDFANVMTYDMNGAWGSNSAHQTALYGNPDDPNYAEGLSVDQTVKFLQEKGAASEKIVIGAAFYTRGWNEVEKGSNEAQPGLFQEAKLSNTDADQTPSYGADNKSPKKVGDGGRAGGVWPYRNISDLLIKTPTLKEYWDDTAKAPYLYSATTGEFFTYDNVKSIKYKTEYVKEHELGGVISWMQSQDKEVDSLRREELTKAIKSGLFGETKLPENNIVYSDLDVSVAISPYSQYGTNGYDIVITNKEQLVEFTQTTDLKRKVFDYVEIAQKTIKLPKLYLTMNSGETLSSGDYKAGTVSTSNGVVSVDLSSVYDGRHIPAGSSYSFKLRTDAKETNVAHFKNISLVQRIGTKGAEINRQVIYGNGELPEPNPNPNDKEAPTVPENLQATSVKDTSVSLSWSPSMDNEGVRGYTIYRDGREVGQSATTTYTDQGLTPATAYRYEVRAFDNSGNISEASSPLTVTTEEAAEVVYEAWKPDTAYNGGDIVTHNGKIYQAKWWNINKEPNEDDPWGDWKLIG